MQLPLEAYIWSFYDKKTITSHEHGEEHKREVYARDINDIIQKATNDGLSSMQRDTEYDKTVRNVAIPELEKCLKEAMK